MFKLLMPHIEPAVKQVTEYKSARECTTKMKTSVQLQCLVCEIASRCSVVPIDNISKFFDVKTLSTGKRLLSELKSKKFQANGRLVD